MKVRLRYLRASFKLLKPKGNVNAVGKCFLFLQGVILSLHIRFNLQVNSLNIGALAIFLCF